jgi:hypothetical protein
MAEIGFDLESTEFARLRAERGWRFIETAHRIELLDIRDLVHAVTPVFDFEVGERNNDRVLLFDRDHVALVFEQEGNFQQ